MLETSNNSQPANTQEIIPFSGEDCTIRLENNKFFYCKCGCNVFKREYPNSSIYGCNGCDMAYECEPA